MNEPNERHPSSLSDEDKAALRASDPAAFDDDDVPAAGDDKVAAAADAAKAPPAEGNPKPKEEGKPEGEDGADPAAAAEVGAGGDKPNGKEANPADQRAVSGLLKELQQTRQELAQLKAEKSDPPRDFKAEIDAIDTKLDTDQKALLDKYDAGEIDATELATEQGKLLKEYQRGTRDVMLAESEHRAVAAVEKREAEHAAQTAQQQWDNDIGKWKEANAAFLENPIRRDAVSNLLNQLGADANMTNEQVIEQMQKAAFEAFNWAPEKPAGDLHAERNKRDAKAIASVAADTPPVNGGVGNRGQSEHPVDVSNMKPGTFSKLPGSEQEKLLGQGAL